jgi:hypothetical protein
MSRVIKGRAGIYCDPMVTEFSKLAALVSAILTRVREREGYVTKTKLFKYLYLVDVEWFRHKGQLFTGFDWIFYHYGPWSLDCESLYSELKKDDYIRVKPGSRPDLDTEFLQSANPVELEKVIDDFRMERVVRTIVDTWADRRLGEMLDFVYFRTEPMEGAEKGKSLDFSKIEMNIIPDRSTSTSSLGTFLSPGAVFGSLFLPSETGKQKAIAQILETIEAKKKERTQTHDVFTKPAYDDLYWKVVGSMKDDDE